MAGNTGPTIEALTTAEDFFLNVVKPNMTIFFSQPSSFATTINLATSLFHMHEWLHHSFQPELENHFNKTFGKPSHFWKEVESTNTNFGYIRDVANASKHVTIGKFPTSTGMSHMANTHLITTSYGLGGFGQGSFGGGPDMVFDDAGRQVSFDDCANDLFKYWESLLQKITGRIHVNVPATGSIQIQTGSSTT